MDHEYLMREVFALAAKGIGSVSPNPLVGAVIVREEKIIGKGFHHIYGGLHAEVNAINNCSEDLEGATLYCNLEPCCHIDKQTPPCVDLLIEKKIAKVYISNIDPNPKVSGKGVEKLRKYGIEVITSVLEEEGEKLNEVFFKYITTKKPFVHLKFAQTMDGKLATYTGDAKWISNIKAREIVHGLRKKYDAILVGRKTLTNDNPRLTSRLEEESCPYRIIIGDAKKMDSRLEVFQDNYREKTIIFSTTNADFEVDLVTSCSEKGRVNLDKMLKELGSRGITSVLIEGGGEIISQFIEKKLYDKITIFIAPLIVGGERGYSNGLNIERMADAISFENIQTKIIDDQTMVEGYVHRIS